MDEMIEKVKSALRTCVNEEETCDGCAYKQESFCTDRRNRDALEVIGLLEEQNKELREANERLLEQLKAARELGQNGVQPMPCKVGDPLWAVIEEEGMISVTKTACKAMLWNGKNWLISDDDCCWEVPDKECLVLSIGAAVKKAEEMLRDGNDA
jgi:hypothetical protein